MELINFRGPFGFIIGFLTLMTSESVAWKIRVEGEYRYETLYLDSQKVQTITYKNDTAVSFNLVDYVTKSKESYPIGYRNSFTNKNSVESDYGYYKVDNKAINDSFKITLWKPIERNKKYFLSLYHDGKEKTLVSEFNSPCTPLKLLAASDTLEHFYMINFVIKREDGTEFNKSDTFIRYKNKEMIYK